jgi:hypothetical protein
MDFHALLSYKPFLLFFLSLSPSPPSSYSLSFPLISQVFHLKSNSRTTLSKQQRSFPRNDSHSLHRFTRAGCCLCCLWSRPSTPGASQGLGCSLPRGSSITCPPHRVFFLSTSYSLTMYTTPGTLISDAGRSTTPCTLVIAATLSW